jgi:hypothetical protein
VPALPSWLIEPWVPLVDGQLDFTHSARRTPSQPVGPRLPFSRSPPWPNAAMVGMSRRLVWLFPVCTDAGVAVSTAVWLSRRHNPDAERFARRLTWALLALTVAGNATHQGLAAAGMIPPWWVAVLVGAIPPGVVGAVVHVAVLVGRGTDNSESQPARQMTEDVHPIDSPAGVPPREDRVAQLIAAGAGRRRLAAELGIPEHRARALLASHRAQARGRGVAR